MNLTQSQIQALISGDPIFTLKFYRQLKPILKKYFYNRIDNPQDRQELVQDTIISILDSLPQFRADSSFKTWFYTIAHHELVDYYRKRKIKSLLFSHFPFLETLADKALGPQLALEEKEKKSQIYQTLKNLNEGYASVLRLKYLEGLSVTQIAQKLNITYKAAESRLSRARQAFADSFVCQRQSSNSAG